MKRLIILLLALTVMLALAAAPVSADPPTAADGDWTYDVDLDSLVQVPVGPNLLTYAEDVGTWTGTFNGLSNERFVVFCVPKADGRFFNYYRGVMSFPNGVEVTDADGVLYAGSMVIKTNGLQISDTCMPSLDFDWHGRWRIIGGSGELGNGDPARIRGHGTFEGPSFTLKYEGQVHFR